MHEMNRSLLIMTDSSSSKFSLRAYPPWPDLPVTDTGFWDPPTVPLTVLRGDGQANDPSLTLTN